MAYLGSWKIDDLLTFCCNTHVFSTGAAADADSVPTYRVYEDETTAPILTGSTALLDSANTVGFYSEQITLSAANGFEKGKCYSIYITATVSSVAATMHHTFQIQAEVDTRSVGGTAQTARDLGASVLVAATGLDAALDQADVVETGRTMRGCLRLMAAVLAGKASGLATTTAVYRNAVADAKARVTATVDADGNRTAITSDQT